MSKVIKSAFENSSYRLEVGKYVGAKHTSMSILGGGDYGKSIAIADKDIPSLMLALGDAAGVVRGLPALYNYGTPEHLESIQWHLTKYVEAQEAIAAEVEETAKLEAEALELCNAHRKATGLPTVTSWEGFSHRVIENWLAVARRAREIAKEATK